MNINDLTPQRREILELVRFEESTAATWPWAATVEEIYQDEEKLKTVEAMLRYDPKDGYDTDQLYQAMDQVFGTNPLLAEQLKTSNGIGRMKNMERPSGEYTTEELCCTVFYMARYAGAMETDRTITVPDERELFWCLLDWAKEFEKNFDWAGTADHQMKLETEGSQWLRETFPYEPELNEGPGRDMSMPSM